MPRLNSNDNLFTSKLKQILENSETQSVMRWGQNKFTIEIIDKTKLLENILPKFFRHNRLESFVRQMNLYGFKKIRSSKMHCFINLELKSGKKLTELKSKNQLKRQNDSNSSSEEQSINQQERNPSEKPQHEGVRNQLFQFGQPSQHIHSMENMRKLCHQTTLQRSIPFYYCQSVPQPYMHMSHMNSYSVYPYSYFVYQ